MTALRLARDWYLTRPRLPYALSRALAPLWWRPLPNELVFALPASAAGWILEGICRDTGRHLVTPSRQAHSLWRLPPARAYFFPHYHFLRNALAVNPPLWRARRIAYFTHKKEDERWSDVAHILRHATDIIAMNSAGAAALERAGIPRRRIHVCPGFADPAHFRPHVRSGSGAVGLCGAYYPRKGLECLPEVARRLPHRRFLVVGRNWPVAPFFAELRALPNVEYVEAHYEDYPSLYDRMDVLLSPSLLEGGPIPVIEAMMSNVVPVASRTGFCPDVIRDGVNGVLFEPGAGAADIAAAVERGFAIGGDVRASVEALGWRQFAARLDALLAAPP